MVLHELRIGQVFAMGWTAGKYAAGMDVQGEEVRVECIGHDWLVVRTLNGGVAVLALPDDQEDLEV